MIEELKKAIDTFDKALNLAVGEATAQAMRAYVRDKYAHVRTREEEDREIEEFMEDAENSESYGSLMDSEDWLDRKNRHDRTWLD
jgi:hypothetical protein